MSSHEVNSSVGGEPPFGNVDGLKEEVKNMGENLSTIAKELARVREKDERGRDNMQ